MSPYTIGADPELFLVDQNGRFISAIGLIGGSKKHPHDIGQGCAIQEDNVAVEFNIPPADAANKFVSSITYALDHLSKQVADKGLFLSITASKSFDKDQLEHPRAKVFGCDPDYNCWTRQQNDPPKAKDASLRSAGGHIHIGAALDKLQLARWCDVTMGLPSVLEDNDTQRRLLYGKAGSFRGKPYGVEYRTLSNYWLQSKSLMEKVFKRAELAIERVEFGWNLSDKDGEEIQAAINNSDKSLAERLIASYGVYD